MVDDFLDKPLYESLVNVNDVKVVTTTFVREEAAAYYKDVMENIKDIYDTGGGAGALASEVEKLLQWSRARTASEVAGELVQDTPVEHLIDADGGGSEYDEVDIGNMDRWMAFELDLIVRTMKATGFDVSTSPPSGSAANFTSWADNPLTGEVINRALNAAARARTGEVVEVGGQDYFREAPMISDSIQQLVNVEYVRRGTDLIFREMSALRDATTVNSRVLTALTRIQEIANKKEPTSWHPRIDLIPLGSDDTSHSSEGIGGDLWNGRWGPNSGYPDLNDGGWWSDFHRDFNTFEEESFNNDIPPTLVESIDDTEDVIEELYLSVIPGGSPPSDGLDMLEDVLEALLDEIAAVDEDPANPGDPNPGNQMVQSIERMLDDIDRIDARYSGGTDEMAAWLLDFESDFDEEGDIQRNITDAITSAQTFNDAQREELRRVMFQFEEFMKSAGAMMSRLTQIIEKVASGIGR